MTRVLAILLLLGCYGSSDTLAAYLVGLGPVRELGRLDHHTCEEFAECVEEITLSLSLFDSVSVFGEGCLQTVIDSLGQMIVEGVEEVLLGLLGDRRVLHQGVRDVVGCHTIE